VFWNREKRELPLLHIDDSASDRLLLREAILLTNVRFELHEADGLESATAYFQAHWREDELTPDSGPALVLLDYDLGNNHTGVEFLHWLRVIKKITSIPVVLLSGSDGNRHIAECYATGANFFVNKPKTLASLMTMVRALYSSVTSAKQPCPIILLQEYQPNPGEGPADAGTSRVHETKPSGQSAEEGSIRSQVPPAAPGGTSSHGSPSQLSES
jgi:CheY-like chemotaxis protein